MTDKQEGNGEEGAQMVLSNDKQLNSTPGGVGESLSGGSVDSWCPLLKWLLFNLKRKKI